MSVTSVNWQTHLSRSGNQNDGTAFAEEYFVIQCNADTNSTSIQGASAGGTTAPLYGSLHPVQSFLYCNSTEYTPMQQNTRQIFQCRAMYTDDPIVDPLTQPAVINWNFSDDGQQPYFLDCSSTPQPVVNSAGELFSDYLTRANGTITATYAINLTPSAAASMAQTLVNYTNPVPAANQGGFTFDGLSISDNQALIKGATISGLQKQNVLGVYVQYRTVTYSLAFKYSWQDKVDDRGFNAKVSSGTGLQPIVMSNLTPQQLSTPWPLDGSGNAKSSPSATPASLTFQPYPKMSFSVFSFS
jgi:hypothetical protein